MAWDRNYTSVAFDTACEKYDKSPIVLLSAKPFQTDDTKKVYISELPRTYETACRLFQKRDFLQTALLNEVPLRSFADTDNEYPLWVWNVAGRLQWFLQSNRQAECRKETIRRAQNLIELLKAHQEDCYLITHGFYMRVLIKELKKQGYQMKKNDVFGISNLSAVTAVK